MTDDDDDNIIKLAQLQDSGELPPRAEEALALARRLGARASEAHALCLAGDVASTGGANDAEGYYREALVLAGELGMRPLVAHCHLGLGRLYRRTGIGLRSYLPGHEPGRDR